MSLQACVPIPGCYIGPWSWGGNYQLVSGYLCPIYLGHCRVLFSCTFLYLLNVEEYTLMFPTALMWYEAFYVMASHPSTRHSSVFLQSVVVLSPASHKYSIGYLCSESQAPKLPWMSMFLLCKLSTWGGIWQTEWMPVCRAFIPIGCSCLSFESVPSPCPSSWP